MSEPITVKEIRACSMEDEIVGHHGKESKSLEAFVSFGDCFVEFRVIHNGKLVFNTGVLKNAVAAYNEIKCQE